jgi:Txe/YoeB family toxin of Txe-Axe toxin-antitoxin module
VTSHATKSFWRRFRTLPVAVQEKARDAYRRFQFDPLHPSLNFEKLKGYPNYWSVRITLNYRAVAVREGDILLWFWIGSHSDFDNDFA